MKTNLKEKRGQTSIMLAAYLLILIGVFSVVLFNIVNLVGGSAKRQLDSLQNFYYLERGAFYAQYNVMKTPPKKINDFWPKPWDPAGSVNIVTTDDGASPVTYNISVTRSGRTLKMTYTQGARTSFGISQ